MEKDNRVKFNERKLMILKLLRKKPMTPAEVANRCGIKPGAARSLLRRYHLNGLLRRETDPRPGQGRNPYQYYLSDLAVDLLEQGKIKTGKGHSEGIDN